MSPNDKIISFGKIPAAAVEAVKADVKAIKAEGEAPITEMEAAIIEAATFMLDNKHRIQNFVCGIACEPNAEDIADTETEFHLITSPIEARDYALALKMFEDGFRRNLDGVIEE